MPRPPRHRVRHRGRGRGGDAGLTGRAQTGRASLPRLRLLSTAQKRRRRSPELSSSPPVIRTADHPTRPGRTENGRSVLSCSSEIELARGTESALGAPAGCFVFTLRYRPWPRSPGASSPLSVVGSCARSVPVMGADRDDLCSSSAPAAPVGSPSMGTPSGEPDRARLRAIAASDRPLAPHECAERAGWRRR